MQYTFTLFFLTLLVIRKLQAQEPDQVIEFFRHGARAPINNYDPQWPSSELGMLTTVGMVEQYDLGKSIAAKYPNLIESGYNPDDVFALANNVPRCIESALVQLSSIYRGLTSTLTTSSQQSKIDSLIAEYTPSLSVSESSRGNYVPVEVNVVSSGSQEELIFNGRALAWCPNLAIYETKNKGSTEMSAGWTTFQTPIQQANSYLSDSQVIGSLGELDKAYDAFIADKFDSKTLPGGISDWNLVESLNYGHAYYQFADEQLQKIQNQLTSFPTIKAIKDQMTNFRQGSRAKKLVLLSGHDKNIFAILASFGVISLDCLVANYNDHINSQTPSYPNCQFPGFASNLIFEFYNTTSNPYVKVYYNDVIVPLCSGQDTCSYDEFIAFLESATEIDSLNIWNEKCGNSDDSVSESGLSTGALIGIIAGFVVVSIFVGAGAWILIKKRSFAKITPINIKGIQTKVVDLEA